MVIVNLNEQIPADLLLVKTSDKKGNCFVETKNLDGETNLKDKSIPKQLYQMYRDYNDSDLCKQR